MYHDVKLLGKPTSWRIIGQQHGSAQLFKQSNSFCLTGVSAILFSQLVGQQLEINSKFNYSNNATPPALPARRYSFPLQRNHRGYIYVTQVGKKGEIVGLFKMKKRFSVADNYLQLSISFLWSHCPLDVFKHKLRLQLT